MKKENTVVIDLETLDTAETAVVVTISAIKFNRFGGIVELCNQGCSEFSQYINVTEQLINGRTTSGGTLEWWRNQSDEAKRSLLNSAEVEPVGEALKDLTVFIDGCQLFSRGTDFDFKILADMFKQLDMKVPWKFNQVRDVRTYIDAFTGGESGYIKDAKIPDWIVNHDSLHDCYRDAIQMNMARNDFLSKSIQPGDRITSAKSE